MKIQDFVNKGITITNSIGEVRKTWYTSPNASIVFPNGWVGSIVKSRDEYGYSVATCDYDGYFDWNILKPFGASDNGTIYCQNEDEVCKALSIIESLEDCTQEELDYYK